MTGRSPRLKCAPVRDAKKAGAPVTDLAAFNELYLYPAYTYAPLTVEVIDA